MKKLFKRSSTKKKLKSNADGSFANVSLSSTPGSPQLSQYSGDSSYTASNISIGNL